MNLVALPAFSDNCIWMLHDGRQAVVVDPGDAAPVVATLQGLGLTLAGILVTHHHADHVGGLAALRPWLQGPVWVPADEPQHPPCVPLHDGARFTLPGLAPSVPVQVLAVPGHTAGHLAYVLSPPGQSPLLFCGDTLFSGGCGRLFEGTPAQMHTSLGRLAALPDDTRVCCAHEYTVGNLRFAAAVEPGNPAVAQALADSTARREAGGWTLPSTIARERTFNPFLRCDQPEVIASARLQGAIDDSGVAVLAALREWKNRFR